MFFDNELIKIQFKLDHLSFYHRLAILLGGLFLVFVPWFFLIYQPQSHMVQQMEQQIVDLDKETAIFQAKYDNILNLIKNQNTKKLILKYQDLQKKMTALNQQITQFNNRYISDRNLANLLYAILKNVDHVKIVNFSTLTKTEAQPETALTSSTIAKTPVADKNISVKTKAIAQLSPDTAYYVLSLKGNYFDILNFMQHTEQLKWQIFWTKLDYEVIHYPEALATIEFYTLRPALMFIGQPTTQSVTR